MRLTVIGCSGSFPGPDSPSSSYLVEADGFRLVIDMGHGALGVLQRYAALDSIDAVLLSHLHADHCVDLYGFRVAREYAPGGPMRVIPVYAPAGALERIAKIHGVDEHDGVADRFSFINLQPGSFGIGPFEVAVAHMNHPVETFGARLSHGGASIAYSADTGETGALVELASGADALLSEASFLSTQAGLPPDLHLTARQAAEHATRADVGQLILTHLVPWNDPEATREEAATVYDGKLTLAKSGLVICP
jgi:ribonuclease BN (tRNA processing enzyme)